MAHFNDEGKMPSQNDALKGKVMNRLLTNCLTSHVGAGSNSQFFLAAYDKTLNRGNIDGVKATNELSMQVESVQRRQSCC